MTGAAPFSVIYTILWAARRLPYCFAYRASSSFASLIPTLTPSMNPDFS